MKKRLQIMIPSAVTALAAIVWNHHIIKNKTAPDGSGCRATSVLVDIMGNGRRTDSPASGPSLEQPNPANKRNRHRPLSQNHQPSTKNDRPQTGWY